MYGDQESDGAYAPGGFTFKGLDFEYDDDAAVVISRSDEDGEDEVYSDNDGYEDYGDSEDQQPQENAEIPGDQENEQNEQEDAQEPSSEAASEEQQPAGDDAVVITGFAALENASFRLAQKPDAAALAEMFPWSVEASIEGMEEPQSFNVAWYCDDYVTGRRPSRTCSWRWMWSFRRSPSPCRP